MSPSEPLPSTEGALRPRRRSAANRSALEFLALFLVLLSSTAGVIAFGAVRLYESGPLATLIYVALVLWGWRLLKNPDIEAPVLPPAFLPMLFALLYVGIMSLFSRPSHSAHVKFLVMATGPVAYLLWSGLGGRSGRWRWALLLWLVIVSILAWYAVVQDQRGTRMVLWMERPADYGMRASGTLACPNHFAHLLVMAICVGAALAFSPGTGSATRLIGAYVAIVSLYPFFLTRSRAGLIGLASGLAVMTLAAAARRGLKWLALAMIATPATVTGGVWAILRYSPVWRARFEQMLRGIETGNDFRPQCWKMTWHMIKMRPWFGWGGGSYEWAEPAYQTYSHTHTAVYAHSEPLHLAMEYGGIGLALLGLAALVWLVRALVLAYRAPETRLAGPTIGAIGAVVASLVHGLFDFNLHIYSNSHALILVMGTAMAVHARAGGLPQFPRWTPRMRRLLGLAFVLFGLIMAASVARSTYSHYLVKWADSEQAKAVTREELRRLESRYLLAVRLDSGNFDAWREIGRIRKNLAAQYTDAPERSQWIADAFAAYRRALAINPYDTGALHGLAQLHRMEGDNEKALEYLREMTRLQPKRAYFHVLLGHHCEQMGLLEEALKAFRAAYDLHDRSLAVRVKIPMLQKRLQESRQSAP